MVTVEVKGLTKRFGDFTAVEHVSFSTGSGEIFGFLGPNGAGKSTTIKMLCGIISPTEGTGSVGGHDIVMGQEGIKNTIGYMSQKFSLYNDLTVRENLIFFGGLYGLEKERLRERMHYVHEMAGIGDRMNHMVVSLPGGIKQRLALGCAMLHDPPILFLDEPTSGVDPIMRRNFWDLIYDFSRAGKTIFVTTHYMDEAEHCDRMALIIAGKIIALDTPEKLKQTLAYDVYALTVDDFIRVFDMIHELPFIDEAAIFGSNIHILCEKGFNLGKSLGSVLRGSGIKKFSIEKIEATLEDVFVTNARRLGV
ncbi:MAG TPA: ABC transporter ATP-binding protein [Spirochaetota bacterium]|nr:ABC transporter ATP-binding protein [Spirochaetota bacterium]